MSHFLVTVLVEQDKFDRNKSLRSQAEDAIAPLLEPYDENTNVPEYDRPCYCVSTTARNEARTAAEAQVGGINIFRESFKDINPDPEDPFSEAAEEAWKKHIAPLVDLEKQLFEAHPLKGKPNPDCEDCSGTGTTKSTYNPKSKWDWYQVGGRWTGAFDATYDPYTDPDNLELCNLCGGTGDRATHMNEPKEVQHPSGCNGCSGTGKSVKWHLKDFDGDVRPVGALPKDFVPFALVTPDGYWHERGKMGWFACVSDEKSKEDWETEVRRLLAEHKHCVAVAVDCHI